MLVTLLAATVTGGVLVVARAASNDAPTPTAAPIAQFTVQDAAAASVLDLPLNPTVDSPGNLRAVTPQPFDPAGTEGVGRRWKGSGARWAGPW
jgi:hypothetical protein